MKAIILTLALLLFISSVHAGEDPRYSRINKLIASGNFKSAINILKPMANKADPLAQRWLGIIYSKGVGVDNDPELANKYFYQSASQNDKISQIYLGNNYFSGVGIRPDYVTAYMWVYLGSDVKTNAVLGKLTYGHVAKAALELYGKRMKRWEIKKARQMALKCRRNNYKNCPK